MLIDPSGLFYGDRISACSDEAQLHFPRILAASNGFGRVELSISKLHSTAYANFKVKPSREEIQGWIREYHANFLLFIFRADNGSTWGQWSVSKGKLPKYKTAEDNRSPSPNHDAFLAYQRSYVELKKARYAAERDYVDISEDFGNVSKKPEDFGNVSEISEDLENLSEISGDLENLSEDFKTFPKGEVVVVVVGEVVGECVGEVEIPKPKPAPAPFVLPEWIDPKVWGIYLEVRASKRAAKTSGAWNAVLKRLDEYRARGHDPNAVLETSIRGNWTDVYEPKGDAHGTSRNHQPGRVERQVEELRKAGVVFADDVPESGAGQVRGSPGGSHGQRPPGVVLEGTV